MNFKALIVILLIAANAYGSEIKKDHLFPPISIFTGVTPITDYYSKIVNVFSKAYYSESRENIIQIKTIVTPSFSPEYVVGVRQEGEKYIAFKLVAKESIDVAIQIAARGKTPLDLSKIKEGIQEYEREISKQTYEVLEISWRKMLQRTQYSKELFGGLDGVSYHFIDSNLRVGWAWSPDPESQTGYLVKLTELLGQLAEATKTKEIESELFNIGTRLNKSLN